MDPFTLLAIATAAGFVFNKMSSQGGRDERREFTFSKDLVARLRPDSSSEFDLAKIEILPEYRMVRQMVESQFPIIFITGGAGTGKSTFVRWIQHELHGSMLLAAPTNLAASNIGGKTLHSLCQLPIGWIAQKDIQLAPKRKELLEAKLLVIDEISMVTANLLDGVSSFLRQNRKVDKPFGGLPVIMVGDMFQLPPVLDDALRQRHTSTYDSPKFYNAKCLQESTYYGVELNRSYRQTDQHFVNLLTRLREGIDLEDTIKALNAGCKITPSAPKGAIHLSPRNKQVQLVNTTQMDKLPGQPKVYKGKLKGQFPINRLPSPGLLPLKKGMQIIFTHNDKDQRFINGSIGTIRRLLDDKIFIELMDNSRLVDVGRITWKEYRYDWSKRKHQIEKIETGSYSQFPLMPGWAMTIHKSQGKTIERVHIDLGPGTFETGQTYVALSRCRSLQGLSLARPLSLKDILIDHESKLFYDNLRSIIAKLPPEQMMEKLDIS